MYMYVIVHVPYNFNATQTFITYCFVFVKITEKCLRDICHQTLAFQNFIHMYPTRHNGHFLTAIHDHI